MSVNETEVITKVSRRIGMAIPQVQRVIDAYADEYVRAERESRPVAAPAKPLPTPKADKPAESPAKATARRPPRPRKADAQKPAEGEPEGANPS